MPINQKTADPDRRKRPVAGYERQTFFPTNFGVVALKKLRVRRKLL
jgi:hypothetical protein